MIAVLTDVENSGLNINLNSLKIEGGLSVNSFNFDLLVSPGHIGFVKVTFVTFRTLSHYLRSPVFPSRAIEVWSMAVTWRRAREPSTTLLAGVGFLSCVHVHVKFKFVRLRKRFSAKLTNAGLLFRVRASNVAVVRGVWRERFSTMTAFERFFPAVLPNVSS